CIFRRQRQMCIRDRNNTVPVPEAKFAVIFLTTFNYITGCTSDAITTLGSKGSTITSEPDTDSYNNKTETQTTPDSKYSTIASGQTTASYTTTEVPINMSSTVTSEQSTATEAVITSCNTQRQFLCIEDNIRENKCIHISHYCDGEPDCLNGSDENLKNCTTYCETKNKFYCPEDTCIDKSEVCDTYYDCVDGYDEKDCEQPCRRDQFDCGENSDPRYRCIEKEFVCDREPDCKNNSDEKDCDEPCNPETEFFCAQDIFSEDNPCIPIDLKCDGNEDCVADDSDELNCNLPGQATTNISPTSAFDKLITVSPSIPPCDSDTEFYCSQDSESTNFQYCIGINLKCDGVEDCSNGSDEKNCTEAVTPIPGTTESTSSPQSFWDSVSDYTTYLPWGTNDQEDEEGNKQSNASLVAIGIGIGVTGLVVTAAGAGSVWNAVKHREEGLRQGETISWKHALWGGLKDIACLKIRRTQTETARNSYSRSELTVMNSQYYEKIPESLSDD
ncbi:hypothetical protein, partial [Endozoicomonas sp.]|uniref:hypothetical protein n=1 Tax=Endozoicomonas sp. TaxID=1892382 RepID=UPI00383A723A